MTMLVSTQPEQGQPLSDLDLYAMAENLLDEALTVVHRDQKIPYVDRYQRAKTALEAGAASSDTWRQCVSRIAGKLQIDEPGEHLAALIARLAVMLDRPEVYHRWAQLAARDALSIVAMVRERRSQRHADTESRRATRADPATSKTTKPTSKEAPECLPL